MFFISIIFHKTGSVMRISPDTGGFIVELARMTLIR